MSPRLVATIQRLPQRAIELTEPTPGTSSPRVTRQTPSGPSRIAVAPTTSRTVQPSIVVGLVSGSETGLIEAFDPRPARDAPELEGPIFCALAGRRASLCKKLAR